MVIRPRKKSKAPEYQNDVEKNQLAIRAVIAKRKHLDASQSALRLVEQAIGGKLVKKTTAPPRRHSN
jgi:hypothetical protein